MFNSSRGEIKAYEQALRVTFQDTITVLQNHLNLSKLGLNLQKVMMNQNINQKIPNWATPSCYTQF